MRGYGASFNVTAGVRRPKIGFENGRGMRKIAPLRSAWTIKGQFHGKRGQFMIFGMTPYTIFHVLLSLIGIFTGFIALFGMIAVAIPARYVKHLAGAWRKIYAVTASIALYLNVFVLVAQLFMKVPSLHVLAPTGSEPPFLISQVVVMAVFIVLTIAAIKIRPEPLHA
jgi:hypothetical protein